MIRTAIVRTETEFSQEEFQNWLKTTMKNIAVKPETVKVEPVKNVAVILEKLRNMRNSAGTGHPAGWELMRDTMDKAIREVENYFVDKSNLQKYFDNQPLIPTRILMSERDFNAIKNSNLNKQM